MPTWTLWLAIGIVLGLIAPSAFFMMRALLRELEEPRLPDSRERRRMVIQHERAEWQ